MVTWLQNAPIIDLVVRIVMAKAMMKGIALPFLTLKATVAGGTCPLRLRVNPLKNKAAIAGRE